MTRLLLGLLLALAATGTLASPAHAADELGLSRDGTSWSGSLDEPLFDPAFRWVPGDEEIESFFVRNQSSDAGELEIDLLGTPVDSLLETGDLEVATRVEGGRWVGVSETGYQPLSRARVAAGDSRRVDVRVRFDEASTNQSQETRLAFDFRVRLSQALPGDGSDGDAGDDGDADGDTDGSGVLPATGAPSSAWLLVFATSCVVVGGVLASRTEHRDG